MKLRMPSILLMVVIVLSITAVVPMAASATSGACGSNLTWELENGVLTISGRGEMTDYSYQEVPWGTWTESIVTVHVADGVTSIGAYAFDGCQNLSELFIGSDLKNIYEAALQGCDNLKKISVAENNPYYSSINGDLYNKDGSHIIQYAVGKMDNVYEVAENVTSIGEYAFFGCKNLKSITIPKNVTQIGECALGECSGLLSIQVDKENANYSSIDGDLYNKDATELVQYARGKSTTAFLVPDSVKMINANAFSRCSNLKNITIGGCVEKIEAYTFASCSGLLSVRIGVSVKSIGGYAFGNCSNLTRIVIPVGMTEINNLAFSGCTSLTDVYYTGSEEEWKGITVFAGNDSLNNATKHYLYSDVDQATHHVSVVGCEKTNTGYRISMGIQTNVVGVMNATLYTCVYDTNGRLKSVLTQPVLLNASEEPIVPVEVLAENGDQVKAFLWSSTLVPFSSSAEIVK